MTALQKDTGHQPMEVRHIDDVEWETIRWPGETGKMLQSSGAARGGIGTNGSVTRSLPN